MEILLSNLKQQLEITIQISTKETNINELIFKSYPKISSNGFYNNYEFIIKNSNTSNKNSFYKNNENLYLSGIFQYNSVLPLIKENEKYKKILKPKFSLKLAPKHTKDNRNEETKIDLNNIFTLRKIIKKGQLKVVCHYLMEVNIQYLIKKNLMKFLI